MLAGTACDSLTEAAIRLLLVEDHDRLGGSLQEALHAASYTVDWVRNLADATMSVGLARYELVLLDLGLPDGDGLDFIRWLRGAGHEMPLIVLTARGGLNDRVAGLDQGADDYLVKPFELSEMLSRCRALLRRRGHRAVEQLACGGVVVDVTAGHVTAGGAPLPVPRREYQLLRALMQKAGRVCSRDYLDNALYSHDSETTPNALEASVSRLRGLLRAADAGVEIRTIRGVGYVLDGQAPGG